MIILAIPAPSPQCKSGAHALATVARCRAAQFNDDGSIDATYKFYIDETSAFDGSDPLFEASIQHAPGSIPTFASGLQVIEAAAVSEGGLMQGATVQSSPSM